MLAVFLLTCTGSYARELIYNGEVLPKSEVQALFNRLTSEGAIDSSEFVVELRKLAESRGLFDFEAELVPVDKDRYRLRLLKTEMYYIRELDIYYQGDSLPEVNEKLKRTFRNRPAKRESILALMKQAVELMNTNGYPFAQSRVIGLEKLERAGLLIRLEIMTGPEVLIDSVQFVTAGSISSDFLKKQIGYDTAFLFDQRFIADSRRSLLRLGYISFAGEIEERFYDSNNRCLLIYNLDRVSSNYIEGALGYDPGNKNRESSLYGFLDLRFYNPFGDGKSFFVNWDKPNQTSSDLKLRLHYPYPLSSGFKLDLSLSQQEFTDLYISFKGELQLSSRLNRGNLLTVGFSTQTITAQGENFGGLFDSRVYGASVGLEWSSFEDFRNLFGHSLQFRFTYLHKRLFDTKGHIPDRYSDDPFLAEIGMRWAKKIYHGLFISSRLNLAGYSQDQTVLAPSEMIKLGGRESLRGYAEQQFLTYRAGWFSLETGYNTTDNFAFYIFSDFAVARLRDIDSDELDEYDDEFLQGTGIGLRLYSNRTALDLSYAVSRGNELSDGLLYLTLKNSF